MADEPKRTVRQYALKPSPGEEPVRPFGDNDLMPFGKHKGEKMKDVPASYLLWLWDNDNGLWRGGGHDNQKKVGQYIRDNIDAIEMDMPDYILFHDPRKMK